MKYLLNIRPSNLVLLAAAPFIIFLFVSSSKYNRSLKAIVGVEQGATALFIGFLILLGMLLAGVIFSARRLFGKNAALPPDKLAWFAVILQLVLLTVLLVHPDLVLPFVNSVIANSVDPYTSGWIQKTVRPRQLTPEIGMLVRYWMQWAVIIYGLISVPLTVLALRAGAKTAKRAVLFCLYLHSLLLAYLMFVAHWGFASGVAITFRAAIFAYFFAAVLGLCWTGLQSLTQKKWTITLYSTISILLLLLAAWFFSQPRDHYVLVGNTDARIAIIKGTPQSVTDTIRFGEYQGANSDDIQIRSARSVTAALELIEKSPKVSGAFVPESAPWQNLPLIWKTQFLAPSAKTPAVTFSVLGLLLLVLTIGAWQHKVHPLAVGSEFFVDTIRGIPMLVIILYIGLPLSGAIKDATSGGIDLNNMTRGVVAIAIGYSAYMAEIFRAGVDAIPSGQIEAAKSLGLSRWKVARLVVLPQALRIVIPPLGNEFIAMIKDTSLLSILSVRDITQRMREFQASSFLPFAPFNTAAILYVIVTLACASFLKWIERRYEQPKQ